MQTQLNQQDKQAFDNLNQTSYLLRLCLNNLDFDVHKSTISDNTFWHVFYGECVIGIITQCTAENDYTFCNIRLYRHIKQKFSDEIKDFNMSDYFEFDAAGNIVKFSFEKFNEYFTTIASVLHDAEPRDVALNEVLVADSIIRLKDYCDEYDEQFSKNMLVRDIRVLLDEYNTLTDKYEKLTNSKTI